MFMDQLGVLSKLYGKSKTALEFNFDKLWAPSIYNFLTPQDILALNNIATSIKLNGKIDYKYKLIDNIMSVRGFKKFASGTNRVIYSYLEDESFIVKVAIDKVGLRDNPAEFYNQVLLQPFVTKCFEVSPCGTVGVFERVMPITKVAQFASMAEDVFTLLTEAIIGKYVIDDVGSAYFMNYGVRYGFGPCLLDYPYVFELDSEKLYCNKYDKLLGVYCGGTIDYDAGFNNLVCTRCGKKYLARDLEKAKRDNTIITGGDSIMKVQIIKDGQIIAGGNERSSDHIIIPEKKKPKKQSIGNLKVSIDTGKTEEVKVETTEPVAENIEEIAKKADDPIEEINREEVKPEPELESKEEVNSTQDFIGTGTIRKDNYTSTISNTIAETLDSRPDREEVQDMINDNISRRIYSETTINNNPNARNRDSKGRFVKSNKPYNEEYEDRQKEKESSTIRRNQRRNKNLDKF